MGSRMHSSKSLTTPLTRSIFSAKLLSGVSFAGSTSSLRPSWQIFSTTGFNSLCKYSTATSRETAPIILLAMLFWRNRLFAVAENKLIMLFECYGTDNLVVRITHLYSQPPMLLQRVQGKERDQQNRKGEQDSQPLYPYPLVE